MFDKRSPVRKASDSGFVFWKQLDEMRVELEQCFTGMHMVLDVETGDYDIVDGSVARSVLA